MALTSTVSFPCTRLNANIDKCQTLSINPGVSRKRGKKALKSCRYFKVSSAYLATHHTVSNTHIAAREGRRRKRMAAFLSDNSGDSDRSKGVPTRSLHKAVETSHQNRLGAKRKAVYSDDDASSMGGFIVNDSVDCQSDG